MSHAQRIALAEQMVETTRRRLPVGLRGPAARLPVVCHDRPSPAILGEEFEPDILGMFVGHALEEEGGDGSLFRSAVSREPLGIRRGGSGGVSRGC